MIRIINLVNDRVDVLAREGWPSADESRQLTALTDELEALKNRESLITEIYMACQRDVEKDLRKYIINLIEDKA